ncbi:MAG: acetate kinase [Rhizobium sp. 63-7]|nr:MAG: acetate kinase [Rhizobium sp. 63-7]
MRILVINAGSSSVKFSVFDMLAGEQRFKSELERVSDVAEAVATIPGLLEKAGVAEIDAVGHRTVHGGEQFTEATLIDDAVLKEIEACTALAPLHNPPILAGIRMARTTWDVPQIAVFDTAFHQTMPAHAYTYAVPRSWREKGLRRYGFHGTSHQYVMERVAEELGRPASELRLISCHLGNGASVCAIDRGVSIDTSMGMTPLEGLVMGTRSGDVDPGIFHYLNRELGLSVAEIEDALYKDSGLAALSAAGRDMRDVRKRAGEGDADARLAIELYAYRVRKYIGAYAAAMNGLDVIAFTGGIGENDAAMRAKICSGFAFLGLAFDETRNAAVKLEGFEAPQVQAEGSRIKVLVTQTREQWMIAKQAHRLLQRHTM